MAANVLTLTIGSITLGAINITVSGGTITSLTKDNVIIKKYNSGTKVFEAFSAFTLTGADGLAKSITPTSAFAQSDIIAIEITNTVAGDPPTIELSDMQILNFAIAITTNTGTIYSDMPDNGSYIAGLNLVNEDDFSTATKTGVYTVGGAPLPANSSLALIKPYLVKYANRAYPFTVTLNNAAGDVANGNYEVTVLLDKQ